MRFRPAISLSFLLGIAITGIGFLILYRANPDETRAPLAVRIVAPIPVLSGHEWVDQFSPIAWLLNVLLWTVVGYAIFGSPSSVKRLLHRSRAVLAAKWRFLVFPILVAASFFVYLIPLPPPSAVQWRWFLREMFRFRTIWPTSLLLAEAGFAVGIQILLLSAMAWILFGRSSLRFLLPAPLILLVILPVPRFVSRGIPDHLLTSPDTAPSRDLPLVCRCPGRFEDFARNPVDVHMDEPWLAYGALFRASDCRKKPLDLEVPISGSDFAIPGGSIVHLKSDEHQRYEWWFYGGLGSTETKLAGPQDLRDRILSSDGESIAWLDREEGTHGPPTRVVLADLAGRTVSAVRLPPLTGWRITLLTVNRSADRIILRSVAYPEPGRERSAAGDGYYEIGFDGRKHWGPWNPVGRSVAEKDGLRLIPRGWVVWNAGHPNGIQVDQRIAWCASRRCGNRTVHKGRVIQSVDVDADGRFIAVAENALLPFGRLSATVYVIDAQTGAEVFRRYLKKNFRRVVRLPGKGFFAYSDEADDSISVFALPKQ